MRLSKNFTLGEFTKSATAIRRGIDNTPDEVQLEAIKYLVENFLQPLRDKLGKPIVINSGFRSRKLNKVIGGSRTSQHVEGEAVDIEVPGMSNYDLAVFIRDNFDFDQLILEYWSPNDPTAGWVHVSYRKEWMRQQVLEAKRVNGRTRYFHGIPPRR